MAKIKGIPFGYKNSWFVFKTDNYEKLKQQLSTSFELSKKDTIENGLKASWDGDWCLLKPIEGYIFLISSEGWRFREQAKRLSIDFDEVHFYSTHRSSDYLVCSKFINGETRRDFSISDGEINFNVGEPTEIELEIANKQKSERLELWKDDKNMCEYNNSKEPLSFLGDEDNLMEIAGNWSINPSRLDEKEIEDECEIMKHIK